MGTIELLRKYAADGTVPQKFNFEHIPLLGEHARDYGTVDDRYLDDWWHAYDAEHKDDPGKLKRADVDKLIKDTSEKWSSEREKNRNTMLSSKEKPASWIESMLSPSFGPKALFNWIRKGTVSSDWLAEQAAIGKNDESLYSPGMRDELKDVVWRVRDKELFNKDRARELRQVDRRATGSAHVAGQALNGATLGLGANLYTKAVTGENIDELARSYGRTYAQDYGEDAARNMENWLRFTGHGAKFLAEMPYMMYGAGLTKGLRGGRYGYDVVSRAAKVTHGLAKLRLGALAGLERGALGYIGAGRLWFPAADAMNMAGYALDNAGASRAGGLLHTGAGVAEAIPASWAMNVGASEFMSLYKIPMYSTAAKWAQRMEQARLAGNHGKFVSAGASLAQYLLTDFAAAPASGLVRSAQDMYNGRAWDPFVFAGDTAANMVEALEPSLRVFDTYGNIATPNRGAELMKSIHDQPEKAAEEYSAMQASAWGVPIEMAQVSPDELDDNAYNAVFMRRSYSETARTVLNGALNELLSDEDRQRLAALPVGVQNSELTRMLADMPQDKVVKAILPKAKMCVQAGYAIDPSIWKWLPQEQRRELMRMAVTRYVTAQYGADEAAGEFHGTWSGIKRLGQSMWTKATTSDQQLFSDALKDPVQAMNIFNGMVATTRGAMSGEGGADDEAMQYYRLFEHSLDADGMDAFADHVIEGLTAEQLGQAMTNSAGIGLSPRMEKSLGRALAARVHEEDGFAASFVPVFSQAMSAGAGVTGRGRAVALETLKNIDPSKMDIKRALGLARSLLSLQGEGTALDDDLKAQADRLSDALQNRVQSAFSEDPIGMIGMLPELSSLWALKNGYGQVASWLQNPLAFWTIAACLITGTLFLGSALLGGDDDDEEDNGDDEKSAEKEFDAMSLMRMRRERMAADIGMPVI